MFGSLVGWLGWEVEGMSMAWCQVCQVCGLQVGSLGELQQHVACDHGKVLCSHCGLVLNSRQALYYHRDKHHRQRDQLRCGICHKVFTRISTRKSHMQFVHGVRPATDPSSASQ